MVFVAVRGVVPGFSTIYTDFPNYYVAGKIAAEGTNIHRLYDDAWFQEQMTAYGIDVQGKFSPFPPPTALLFIPFAPLEPITAQRVMTSLNLLLLLGSVRLLALLMNRKLLASALVVFLSGIGLANCFRFGQMYIAVGFALILGYYLYTLKRPLWAGVVLGFFFPIKYFPAVLLLPFVFRKDWNVVFGAAASSLALLLVSILVLGWDIHHQFILSVFGKHFRSDLTMQNPFVYNFQSFDSLFRRLFVFDPTLNPQPFLDVPILYYSLKYLAIGSICIITAMVLLRLHKSNAEQALPVSMALCGILGLLISPVGATYHFVLLWLPMGLLIAGLERLENGKQKWLLGLIYSAIGFIPYSVFARFDGHGFLSVLAYPRLFLMILLFAVALWIARVAIRKSSPLEKLTAL